MLPEHTSARAKVFIFGLGEIGNTTASALASLAQVRAYDPDKKAVKRAQEVLGNCNVEVLCEIRPDAPQQGEIVIDCTRNTHLGQVPNSIRGRDVKAFVNLSSFAVYGNTTRPPSEATPCAPVTAYGAAKQEQEMVAQEVQSESLLGTLSLRLPGIVSRHCTPRSSKSTKYVHSAILEMAKNDAPMSPVNLAEYIHQDRYIALIRAIVAKIAETPPGQRLSAALNVCGGQMLTHRHAWSMFCLATWRRTKIVLPPSPPPQLPLMSADKLRNFLGANTYSKALRETPVSAFWKELVPSVLTKRVAA